MIVPQPEILLVAAMVGLYLYDSAILLPSHEGVLSSTLKGRWSVFFGSESYTLRGKEPFLPNPLLPHRPVFHLRWQQEARCGPVPLWTPPSLAPYRVLSPLISLMALALFILIPAGLFSPLGTPALAAGLILFYMTALAALGYVWARREAFGLTPRRFASLAFESLTCPPFALNISRHISWSAEVPEDLVFAARRLLCQEDWEKALAELIKRIDSAIAWEEEGSVRSVALATHQATLTMELESCRDKKSLPSC